MFIQPDSRVVSITVGDDFRGHRDQNSSYQHFECLWCWARWSGCDLHNLEQTFLVL